LNIVAADTVIIYDQDFNPKNDTQAADRCHRLGQTRQVKVFKLIAENTVDAYIWQIANEKMELDMTMFSANETLVAAGQSVKQRLARLLAD
jgi:SNF2 family DNA or RNA helicase